MDRLIDGALHGWNVAWFAPTYKQLIEVWRRVTEVLAAVTRRRSEQSHRLELWTGGVIDMWSLDQPDTARGRAYRLVVVNEAAMVTRLQESWEQVIRPTLTDYQGSAWFLSTPRGFNYFHALYERGQDPEQPEWRGWCYPTLSNPYVPPGEIEAARRELPERTFAQEYMAAFVADEAAVFRNVRACATATAQTGRVAGHQYVIGCDWGQSEDYSVFAVIDVTLRALVALDRSNRLEYTTQAARLQALADRFRPLGVVAENNSMGNPIIAMLRRPPYGLPVLAWTATNASKMALVETLQLALEQRTIALLPDTVLLAELEGFAATRLPSGMIRYAAPEGMHDDTVMALAMAWQAASAPRRAPRLLDFTYVGDAGG